jgi:nucleoid-associated protein YgaU
VNEVEENAPAPVEDTQQQARRWLRILLLASLACLFVVLCSELPQPTFQREAPTQSRQLGPQDQFIVAGQRVGFLRLGLPIADVEARLGRGMAKPTQTAVLYRFPRAGLTCAVQRGLVASILVHNTEFKTPQGTAVNSEADQVVRELGDQYEFEVQEPYEGAQQPPDQPTPEASPTAGTSATTGRGRTKVTNYTLHYWREGIHVTLQNDKVESIMITPPAGT